MTTPRTERPEYACTCGLEDAFQAVDDGEPILVPLPRTRGGHPAPTERYSVIDAECVTMGFFPSMAYAELVAYALNELGIAAEKRDKELVEKNPDHELPNECDSGFAWCLRHMRNGRQ